MSFHTILTVTLAIFVYVFYRFVFYPAFISPLSKLPTGHPSASFLPTWRWWKRRTGYQVRSILAAHQLHGPIVRLAPNEVSVASLEGLRKIYGGGGGFERTKWYLKFRSYDGTPNLVNIYDVKQHAIRRRMTSHIYSKSYLLNSVDFQLLSQDILFERLLPVLDNAAQTGQVMDMYELACAVGVEFMVAYQMGIQNGLDIVRKGREHERRVYLENGKKKSMELKGYKRAVKEMEDEWMEMCRKTENFLKLSSSIPEKSKLDDENKGTEQVVEERSKSASTYPVVFALLRASIPVKEHPKNLQETFRLIGSDFLDNMEAARIGVGIALTYAMYEISQRSDLKSSLHKELMTLEKPLSYPPCKNILSTSTLRQLDNLPLLDAVLTETLRLHSPFPSPQLRVVPKGGTVIEGYFIPAGVTINSSAYCLHRNQVAYPEANVWKPERWLKIRNAAAGQETRNDEDGGELEKGRREDDPRRWLWMFGSGGKMCTGNNFALLVLKLLMASIYTNFATTVIATEGMEQLDNIIASPVGDKMIFSFDRVPMI